MAISALATEAKATALIAEARRCLAIGSGMQGDFLKDLIDQLESVSVNDHSTRADQAPSSILDGRDAAGKTTAGG